jgi:hypothetical protein
MPVPARASAALASPAGAGRVTSSCTACAGATCVLPSRATCCTRPSAARSRVAAQRTACGRSVGIRRAAAGSGCRVGCGGRHRGNLGACDQAEAARDACCQLECARSEQCYSSRAESALAELTRLRRSGPAVRSALAPRDKRSRGRCRKNRSFHDRGRHHRDHPARTTWSRLRGDLGMRLGIDRN